MGRPCTGKEVGLLRQTTHQIDIEKPGLGLAAQRRVFLCAHFTFDRTIGLMSTRTAMPAIECVDDLVAKALRKQTPAESVAQINSANQMARLLLAAGIRRHHPQWNEEEVTTDVARRMLRAAD
jgi:hypothetical protein